MKVQFVNRTRAEVPLAQIRGDLRKVLLEVRRRKLKAAKFQSLALVFVTAAGSRRLNRRFLKKNRPAGVLSFHYGSEAEIITAPSLIRKESQAGRRPFARELRRMIVHGLLHLCGYHHEGSRKQAKRFEKLEQSLLIQLGIL